MSQVHWFTCVCSCVRDEVKWPTLYKQKHVMYTIECVLVCASVVTV